MGREVVRGGSAGSILGTSGNAFRPIAEAASRNLNGQRAIERPRLGAIRAPCFVRRGGHFANAFSQVKDSDFQGRGISMLALLAYLLELGSSK